MDVSHVSEKRAIGWGTFWWLLSIVLHGTVVFLLVWYTPLRKWFFHRPSVEESMQAIDTGRVNEVVQILLNLHTRKVREKVEEQRSVQKRLQELRDRRYRRFQLEAKRGVGYSGKPMEVQPITALGAPLPNLYEISIQRMELGQLYNTAQDFEKTTFETYRQFRAIELARLQGLSLSEASDVTKLAIPTHPPLDTSVFGAAVTALNDPKLIAMKEELKKAEVEVSAMLAQGQRMLDLAEELMGDDVGATIGYYAGGTAPSNMDDEGGASGSKVRMLKYFDGYTAPDPKAFEHTWGIGVGPVIHKNQVFPRQASMTMGQTLPVGGRKLMGEEGEQAEWMFIDTWYIIGPFPNPNRENLDRKFPPESGVDLDATYVGKDGVKLQWLFRESYTVCIFPQRPDNYAIWYAYTEVYSDRDQDRWVIFGSDDYGKCWMNDEMIFASGKTPHPWIPDRGYKKIHFKKGYNKILFKVENAWGRTGFSMCIYLGEM